MVITAASSSTRKMTARETSVAIIAMSPRGEFWWAPTGSPRGPTDGSRGCPSVPVRYNVLRLARRGEPRTRTARSGRGIPFAVSEAATARQSAGCVPGHDAATDSGSVALLLGEPLRVDRPVEPFHEWAPP